MSEADGFVALAAAVAATKGVVSTAAAMMQRQGF